MLNDPNNPQPSSPATPAASTETPPSQPAAKPYSTIEEAEAHWQNRLSGKDRAHNAAEQALRDEIARLQAQQSAPSGQSGTGAVDPAVLAAQAEAKAAREALDAATKKNEMLARKGKYPALAASGVADDVFAITDEATLARLNALADDGGPGGDLIAPTSPARTKPAPAKPLNEQSKEELEAELKKLVDAGANLRG